MQTRADKNVLLRRVYLDLIGLPPTPEQVAAFAGDRSPKALAKVVDQLLASPHYGERWGRHWLDVARYSDDKLNIVADEPYPNAFRYRDWVIQAFNDDMPYDTFVKAQIAADLLPAGDREKLMPALGFYGMSAQYQEDRPDATGQGFSGIDCRMRSVPRSQIRPDSHEGLLLAARSFHQYEAERISARAAPTS